MATRGTQQGAPLNEKQKKRKAEQGQGWVYARSGDVEGLRGFLGKHKRQCVSSPPPGTPKQTVRYLVKMLRMCHKHHGHHHKGGKGGRGGRKRGGGK